MGWKDIPRTLRDSLLGKKIGGIPVEELAAEVGMRPTTLDRRLREWANKTGVKKTKTARPKDNLKRWDEPPVFKGSATITGDYHMPYLDYDFADVMLNTSERILDEPRRLIIAGDLFNMSVFSRYPSSNRYKIPFLKELGRVRQFISDASDVFDHIDALVGNHELRLVYQLFGEISPREFEALIGNDRLRFYEYGHALINTERGTWRATHQKNYSRNAQSVGVKLAHKFRQNVITHHQHIVSYGFDSSGENVVIDNGCMADPGYLDYASMIDTTNPAMMQSFVIINNGVGSLYTNHAAATDYSFL
jgi:hypothetical protein